MSYDYQPVRTCPLPASFANEMRAQDGPTHCIVTCHNYGRYLRHCLDSLLAQTVRFAEIIVVDDASTDDTAVICRGYASRGVRYLRVEHRNFTTARLAGLNALPRSRFLLFVDADNWLAENFHELLLAELADPRAGVAYGTIARHDADCRHLRDSGRPFDYRALRRQNFADACSLIRTEAYHQAGGWEENEGLTDWLLWLKLTRCGWTMRFQPAARLNYRHHDRNMNRLRKDAGRDLDAAVDVFRRGHLVTIVTLFSGRAWMLPRYAAALRALCWNHANLRIVAIDNSNSPLFAAQLATTLDSTGLSYQLIRDASRVSPAQSASDFADDKATRRAQGYALSEHLARLYALARESMPAGTDLVWCLEDDIEPPQDTLWHFAAALATNLKCGALSAVVRSRFRDNALLAWQGQWGGEHNRAFPLSIPPEPGQLQPLLASGFMCTLFRREVWDAIAFRPSPLWNSKQPYYDWAAGAEVSRLGWQWLLHGSVRAGHWQADGTCLAV